MAGSSIRTSLFVLPPLRLLDSLGGLVLGAVAGAGDRLGRRRGRAPPSRPARPARARCSSRGSSARSTRACRLALARRDRARRPVPAIQGPEANVAPPDPALLASPARARRPQRSSAITGSACGLGVSGSGWAAAPNLVVTNAHVVAGMKDPRVDRATATTATPMSSPSTSRTTSPCFASPGLGAPPLPIGHPVEGESVAILGYPENGPFTAAAGRDRRDQRRARRGAYGRGPVSARSRRCAGGSATATRAGRRSTTAGACETTVFAARVGADNQGYGVPTEIVQRPLAEARDSGRVSTGPCVER